MKREKLLGPKILGKIDLSTIDKRGQEKRQEQKEYRRSSQEVIPDIESIMSHNISLVQERLSSFEGAPEDIINDQGQINIESFVGEYSSHEIEFDKKMTHEEKKGFYKTYEPEIQERYGTKDQDVLVELIENDEREKMRDGNISEDLLFIMMNKIAGDRYVTVRSSDYDDFRNGIDMLLVDTQTDSVICAFDATVSGEKSRAADKVERAGKRVKNGKGFSLKYGISFTGENENPAMKLGELDNLAALFLDIHKKDLTRVLRVMNFSIDSQISDAELDTANHLLDKLELQIGDLQEQAGKNISYDSSKEFIAHVRQNLNDL